MQELHGISISNPDKHYINVWECIVYSLLVTFFLFNKGTYFIHCSSSHCVYCNVLKMKLT